MAGSLHTGLLADRIIWAGFLEVSVIGLGVFVLSGVVWTVRHFWMKRGATKAGVQGFVAKDRAGDTLLKA